MMRQHSKVEETLESSLIPTEPPVPLLDLFELHHGRGGDPHIIQAYTMDN